MKDLTKGKISTLILGFAIPVFLGNLLQLTYSLADTRIVGTFLGWLGEAVTERLQQICDDLSVCFAASIPTPFVPSGHFPPDRGNRPLEGEPLGRNAPRLIEIPSTRYL